MKLRGVNYDVGIEFTPQYHSRPVFDPATFGRARLHNDNEGVARPHDERIHVFHTSYC